MILAIIIVMFWVLLISVLVAPFLVLWNYQKKKQTANGSISKPNTYQNTVLLGVLFTLAGGVMYFLIAAPANNNDAESMTFTVTQTLQPFIATAVVAGLAVYLIKVTGVFRTAGAERLLDLSSKVFGAIAVWAITAYIVVLCIGAIYIP